MLNLIFKPHRVSLRADTADAQKVFAMLKLIPQADVAAARPPLALALVVDTSGSMQEQASEPGYDRATKLERAMEAAHTLVDDDRLGPDDRVAVIHFDDSAQTLLPLTPLFNRHAAHQAIDSLRRYSGGTHMAQGMRLAERELAGLPPQIAKRVLLLTDGQTFDEPDCRPSAVRLAGANTPIVALGLGTEYNHELLRELAGLGQGRPYHLQNLGQLPEILNAEVGTGVREVVTDLQASVATVKGVILDSVTRVYPSLAEVDLSAQPYRLGNVAAGDYTVFVFEFTAAGFARPSSRVRLARVGLTGHAPGLGRRDEMPPQDLFVTFTPDEGAVAAVEAEVLGYVQQKNVDRMVQDAVRQAPQNAVAARQTLQTALGMTQRIGNAAVTQMLQNALDELDQTGTLSSGTRKTVSLGGRTKTVKLGGAAPLEGVPPEEEIRRLTGT